MVNYGGNIDFPTLFLQGEANHDPQPKISRAKLMGYCSFRELMAVAWGSLLAGDKYNPLGHGGGYLDQMSAC